jgi:hypothetical protein
MFSGNLSDSFSGVNKFRLPGIKREKVEKKKSKRKSRQPHQHHVHILMDLASRGQDAAVPDPSMIESTLALIEANHDAAIRSDPDENRRLAVEFDRAFVLGNWRGLDRLIETLLVQPDSCY